ncbi:hypothetical protein [Enterocloster citroniae]|uniref:hypothetical protein n=1 Tax=Enterocloster citroniae TaxID=358743 RepID=UPI0002F49791|nr:hypothetical protein [Enterocloster citroniae]
MGRILLAFGMLFTYLPCTAVCIRMAALYTDGSLIRGSYILRKAEKQRWNGFIS